MFTNPKHSSRLLISNKSNDNNFLFFFNPSGNEAIAKDGLSDLNFWKHSDDISAEYIWKTFCGYFVFLAQEPTDLSALEESLQNAFPTAPEHNSFVWASLDEAQQLQIIQVILIDEDGQTAEGQILNHGSIQTHIKSGKTSFESSVSLNLTKSLTKVLSSTVQISHPTATIIETSHIQALYNMYIPLEGEDQGTLISDAVLLGNLNEETDSIPDSLAYYFPIASGQDDSQEFPILDSLANTNSSVFSLTWNPLSPLDPEKTNLIFTGQKVSLKGDTSENEKNDGLVIESGDQKRTFFRTIYGEPIDLIPITDSIDSAKIVLQSHSTNIENGTDFSLALSGPFEMKVQEPLLFSGLLGPAGTYYMICGLAGTEYIGFQGATGILRGNAINFIPEQPAYAPNFPLLGQLNQSGPLLTDKYSTSWLEVTSPVYETPTGATVSPPTAQYYSQPVYNSLFEVNQSRGGTGRNILDYYQSLSSLLQGPTASDQPFQFPLVPYAGVKEADINAFLNNLDNNHNLKDFENQILNPTRRDNIQTIRPEADIGGYDPVKATSPEGLFVHVDGQNGKWAKLMLAKNFDPAGPTSFYMEFENLETPLQNAFQTNQQFLVVSKNEHLGLFTDRPQGFNFKPYFNNTISIEEWPFIFNVPEATAPTEVNNVIIFKYTEGALSEWVKNSMVWTNSSDFTEDAPALALLLSQFVEDGVQAALDGDANYNQFAEIVTDPKWTGVLGFNIDVVTSSFPPQLQGLLAGIDLDLFKAHHVGININLPSLIGPPDQGQLGFHERYSSSMFALIDYKNPKYKNNEANKPIDLEVSPSTPYAYSVLELKVLFENSKIEDFKSKIQLSMDEMFSSGVTKTTVNNDIQDPKLRAILFDGFFSDYGGQPLYTFTAQRQANPQTGRDELQRTKFFLDNNILNFVEVTNGNFVTLQGATGINPTGPVQSQFSLYSNLSFNPLKGGNPEWDLFSFGGPAGMGDLDYGMGLSLSNLNVALEFPIEEPTQEKTTFSFQTDTIVLEESNSVARAESFYRSFPMNISGFVTGASGTNPSSYGYPSLNLVNPGLSFLPIGDSNWYGLLFDLNLGTQGTLASGTALISKLLVAWGANSSASNNNFVAAVSFELPGIMAGSNSFRIENVLEFTSPSQSMSLTRLKSGKLGYQLTLEKAAFKFLGLTFPANKNGDNFYITILSDPNGRSNSLAWYGALGNKEIALPNYTITFLGIAQRIALKSNSGNTVEDIITAMQDDFEFPNFDNPGNNVDFNGSKHWLIGGVFNLIKLFDVSFVFDDDSNIYGLNIDIVGGWLSYFKFEIPYQKVSDTVGLYSIVLNMPVRDFKIPLKYNNPLKEDKGKEAIAITLPTLTIDWYTDGSFRIDLGFPDSITDFSKSFTIILAGPTPYIGSGGVYFGYLHAGASIQTPITTRGVFDPVVEFGLALSMGIAKQASYGPLSAIATITVVGMIEGVVGFYKPNPGEPGEGDTYIKITGTVGVVAKVLLSVNIYFIQATAYAAIAATVAFAYESYRAIHLIIEGIIDVYFKVVVKLGFFNVTVTSRFNKKITIPISIGKDNLKSAPWYDENQIQAQNNKLFYSLGQSARGISIPILPVYRLSRPRKVLLNLKSTFAPTVKSNIDLYLVPHITAARNQNGLQGSKIVSMLYVPIPTIVNGEIPPGPPGVTGSFKNLAETNLAWVINSYVNAPSYEVLLKTPISLQELTNINYTLANSEEPPLSYTDIKNMMEASFNVYISNPANLGQDFEATIFPMFPDLTLSAGITGRAQTVNVNFDKFSQADEAYVEEINEYFEKLNGDFQTDLENQGANTPSPAFESANTVISMSEYVFQDYFQMIAQSGLDQGIDYMQEYPYSTSQTGPGESGPVSLLAIAHELNSINTIGSSDPHTLGPTGNAITPAMIAAANTSVPLSPLTNLIVGGYQIPANNLTSLTDLSERFGVSSYSLGMSNASTLGMVNPNTQISLNGAVYTVKSGDTFLKIAQGLNTNGADPEVNSGDVATALTDSKIPTSPFLNIPNITYNPPSNGSLQAVANRYISSGIGGPMGPIGIASGYTTAPTFDVLRIVEANQVTPGVVTMGATLNPIGNFGATVVQDPNNTFLSMADYYGVNLVQLSNLIKDESILNSQTTFAIPSILINIEGSIMGPTFSNFEQFSAAYGVDIPYLAGFNEGVRGIFENENTLNIPNIVALEVGDILNGIFGNADYLNNAGMATQFFLQGLRLPITNGVTFGPPYQNGAVAPLYQMLGQQYDAIDQTHFLPNNAIGLQKSVGYNPSFLSFKNGQMTSPTGLSYQLDHTQVGLATGISGTVLNAKAQFLPMTLAEEMAKQYQLKNHTSWAYPGQFNFSSSEPSGQVNQQPAIWSLPNSLLDAIQENDARRQNLIFSPIKSTRTYPNGQIENSPLEYYNWATFLNIKLKKVEQTNALSATLSASYELIGADETSVVYLERLLKHLNLLSLQERNKFANESQAYFLFQQSSDQGSGLISEALGGAKSLLVQANLSTYTNPEADVSFSLTSEADEVQSSPNLLNSFDSFVELLWEASIVRSGGYYLYYIDEASQQGLPANLFNDGSITEISLVLTYPIENTKVRDFVNCLIVGDAIDLASDNLYVEDTGPQSKVANLPPGNIGFEALRDIPDSGNGIDPSILLQQNYNLLGYQVAASPAGPTGRFTESVEGLPAGPESITGPPYNQKYNKVVPISSYFDAPANQLDPLNGSGSTGPKGTNSPYLGIGMTATVNLAWVDLFGNKINFTNGFGGSIQDKVALGQKLGYTDPLIAISKYPEITYQYGFTGSAANPVLNIAFNFDYESYKPVDAYDPEDVATVKERASIAIETYNGIYYQLSDILYRYSEMRSNIFISTSIDLDKQNAKQIPFSRQQLADFLNYITEIYWFLYQVKGLNIGDSLPDGPGKAKDGNYFISLDTFWNNDSNIFELKTEFTIKRDANFINPEFLVERGHNPVESVTTEIIPTTSNKGSDNDGYDGLTDFAKDFEAVFLNRGSDMLKIAQGIDRFDLDGPNGDNKQIWAVHFGGSAGTTGISYAVGQTGYYYAPSPLANSLVSMHDVFIKNYNSSDGLTGGVYKSFSSVNIDSWAAEFVSALDNFLSPEFGIPSSVISLESPYKNVYQGVLDAKKLIAESASVRVLPIIGPTGPGYSNVQERFKQNVLLKLSNIYSVSAIIENTVDVGYGTGAGPTGHIRLFGQPIVSSNNNANNIPGPKGNARTEIRKINKMMAQEELIETPGYSISTAKIPIGKGDVSSELTYLFSTPDAINHKSIDLDLSYNLTHIEHQIGEMPGITGYQPSSWLSFVIPIDESGSIPGVNGEIGKVSIPIPLREYPAPPSVLQQSYTRNVNTDGPSGIPLVEQLSAPTGVTGDGIKIQQAKYWQYQYEYSEVQADQDNIQAFIEYNGGPKGAEITEISTGYTLASSLAQFVESYPSILRDMEQYLTQVNLQTSPDSDTFKIAAKAARAFTGIATTVSVGWKAWPGIVQNNALEPDMDNFNVYKISEDPSELPGQIGDLILIVKGNDKNKNPQQPVIVEIPNSDYLPELQPESDPSRQLFVYRYKNGNGNYLKYADRLFYPFRTTGAQNLDIISLRSAWGGVSVIRNEYLVEHERTNMAFIYQTPMVRLKNPVFPFLLSDEFINIAKVASNNPQKLALVAHLYNLFGVVYLGSIGYENIQMECYYSYSLQDKDLENSALAALEMVTLPVFLTVKFFMETETSINNGIINDMADIISKWMIGRGLDKNSSNSSSQHYQGRLLFKITLFSLDGDDLPKLEISNLILNINDIDI